MAQGLNLYILGYRNGYCDYSWSVDFFCRGENKPAENVKMSDKEVRQYFKPDVKCDYYIVRGF